MKRKYRRKITADYKSIGIQCRKNGRDNKDYYHSGGYYSCKWSMRVPSIKANDRTWNNFYRLFPKVKERILSGEGNFTYEDDGKVIVERMNKFTGSFLSMNRVVMIKYKKTW